MDLRLWALAFTVLDWTERQKAECWGALQAGAPPALSGAQAGALALGKELWVCLGAPEDPSAEGPNFLLREGTARICLSPANLLEDRGPLTNLCHEAPSLAPKGDLW